MSTYIGKVVPLDYTGRDTVMVDDGGNGVRLQKSQIIITKDHDGVRHAYFPPFAGR